MFDAEGGFLRGVNYWPVDKAMYWWRDFERGEVERDFALLAANNFKLVRIFLTWEDFQPQPELIPPISLENLLWTADCAVKSGLGLIPTFFCGHMSGVNWLPCWMTEDKPGASRRFKVYPRPAVGNAAIKNFYADEELMAAQSWQIAAIVKRLQGHPGIHSYDLGNESSNLVMPDNREQARNWLKVMVSSIKNIAPVAVTIGMHAEDLEEDRRLRPQDAACYCDYLSMHAYPFYLPWVEDPDDFLLAPFLVVVTEWLGQKPVVMQEFGMPTLPEIAPFVSDTLRRELKCPLWNEREAALYYEKTLAALGREGTPAVLGWCFADYAPGLWDLPPLKDNPHERYFGLFRHDGLPKATAAVFKKGGRPQCPDGNGRTRQFLGKYQREAFYQNPRHNLALMFKDYKSELDAEAK